MNLLDRKNYRPCLTKSKGEIKLVVPAAPLLGRDEIVKTYKVGKTLYINGEKLPVEKYAFRFLVLADIATTLEKCGFHPDALKHMDGKTEVDGFDIGGEYDEELQQNLINVYLAGKDGDFDPIFDEEAENLGVLKAYLFCKRYFNIRSNK